MIKKRILLIFMLSTFFLSGCIAQPANNQNNDAVKDNSENNIIDSEQQKPTEQQKSIHTEPEKQPEQADEQKQDESDNSEWEDAVVTPTAIVDMDFNNEEKIDKYKIELKVPEKWEQNDADFYDVESRRLEGLDCLFRTTEDFVLDKNIKDLIHTGGIINVDGCNTIEGTTKKGYQYVVYEEPYTEENINVFYWVFIRVSDKIMVNYFIFLDISNIDYMQTILDSIVFTEVNDVN